MRKKYFDNWLDKLIQKLLEQEAKRVANNIIAYILKQGTVEYGRNLELECFEITREDIEHLRDIFGIEQTYQENL